MSTIAFDTLDFVSKLRAAGFDEQQAGAVVRVVAEAQSSLVTREHFDNKIELLRVEHAHTRWMMGILIALAVANFAKQFF